MTKKLVAISLALAFGAQSAIAETPAITTVVHKQPMELPPAVSSPIGMGRPHTCPADTYYPKEGFLNNAEGTTVLAFTIQVDGTVDDVRVIESSKNPILDKAAVACATTWLYRPAQQSGVSIRVAWKAQVMWSVPWSDLPVAPPESVFHRCDGSDQPSSILLQNATEADITYWIGASGAVKDISFAKSSGSAELDKAITQCVAKWAYQPANRNGRSVGVLWGAKVRVVPRFGMAYVDRGPELHGCSSDVVLPPGSLLPGTTVLQFKISPSGDTSDFAMLESSGNAELDQVAMTCAKSWHYVSVPKPGQSGDTPWSAQVDWKQRFVIAGELGNPAIMPKDL